MSDAVDALEEAEALLHGTQYPDAPIPRTAGQTSDDVLSQSRVSDEGGPGGEPASASEDSLSLQVRSTARANEAVDVDDAQGATVRGPADTCYSPTAVLDGESDVDGDSAAAVAMPSSGDGRSEVGQSQGALPSGNDDGGGKQWESEVNGRRPSSSRAAESSKTRRETSKAEFKGAVVQEVKTALKAYYTAGRISSKAQAPRCALPLFAPCKQAPTTGMIS